jgi:hypothetical protein
MHENEDTTVTWKLFRVQPDSVFIKGIKRRCMMKNRIVAVIMEASGLPVADLGTHSTVLLRAQISAIP